MSVERMQPEIERETLESLLTEDGVENIVHSGRFIRSIRIKDEDLFLLEIEPSDINKEYILVIDEENPNIHKYVRPEDGMTMAFTQLVPFSEKGFNELRPRIRTALIDNLMNEGQDSSQS